MRLRTLRRGEEGAADANRLQAASCQLQTELRRTASRRRWTTGGRRQHLASSKRAGYLEGILAEADGLLMGRFLMSPLPGAHPALEQRLVAIALADQAGAALFNARRAR